MNGPDRNRSFYSQMISFLKIGLAQLDLQTRDEVFRFLVRQQNTDGGFCDRSGRSDLYYSLFGMMIMEAGEMQKTEGERQEAGGQSPGLVEGNFEPGSIEKLKRFVVKMASKNVPGFIEQCCLALLQKESGINCFSRIRILIKLSRSFWKERYSINLSYRSFVSFLTLDAVLPFQKMLMLLFRKLLLRLEADTQSSCPEVAAKVFLGKMRNQNGKADLELLQSFSCDTGGFRAFQHSEKADMLSTAVALYALDFAGCDLRLLKSGCLGFIRHNFADGAFLSGDGDLTTDLEYTFYGLLALGVLAA
jgi:prenyltransferase beta subunit